MNRRDFLKLGFGAIALSCIPSAAISAEIPKKPTISCGSNTVVCMGYVGFEIGDVVHIHGTGASELYTVTAVDDVGFTLERGVS